jgi:hypothetical protein
MRRFIIPALLAGVAGCGGDHPTAENVPAPTYAMAGQSGCYAVSGLIEQSGLFPLFAGSISGDIEGTVATVLDPAAGGTSGRVSFSSGEQTWEVTGGVVSELIGGSVRLVLRTEIVFAQPPVGRNNTSATVVEGAASGNLTYQGTLAVIPPPPFDAEVEYRGVICP